MILFFPWFSLPVTRKSYGCGKILYCRISGILRCQFICTVPHCSTADYCTFSFSFYVFLHPMMIHPNRPLVWLDMVQIFTFIFLLCCNSLENNWIYLFPGFRWVSFSLSWTSPWYLSLLRFWRWCSRSFWRIYQPNFNYVERSYPFIAFFLCFSS